MEDYLLIIIEHSKMAEMDLSELPSDLIRETVCETIENKLKTKNYSAKIDSASKAGEHNFIGVVYRVSFNKNDGKNEEQYKLILKVAPQHPIRRSEFRSRCFFLREIYMYNEVNNKMMQSH